jgi:flagellar basal-body rod protein FlgB
MGLLRADVLLGLMDAAGHNHEAIANNLANVNTPGYRTGRVRFAAELEALLDEQGRLRPGGDLRTELYRPLYADASLDGNDVQLSREIVQLNKNMLSMRLYLAVLGARIRRIQAAIDGR